MSGRTCWIYCPKCRHDLNGDNDSFIDDCGDLTRYRCEQCGFRSEFLLDAPVPIYIGSWAWGVSREKPTQEGEKHK